MEDKWLLFKGIPFDVVAKIKTKKKWFGLKKVATLIVHEEFLKYMNTLEDKKEQKELTKLLVEQATERWAMKRDSKHPFYNDDDGFAQYSRVKYKKLHDHIARMIDRISGKKAK